MKRRRRGNRVLRWLAAAVGCASYLLIFACNTPYIPIPPPNPTFSPGDTAGDWSIQTAPDSRAVGARFFIYNATLGSGIIQAAEPDGSMYAYGLRGQVGDRIQIHWERTPTDSSSTICRPLGQGLVLLGCQ